MIDAPSSITFVRLSDHDLTCMDAIVDCRWVRPEPPKVPAPGEGWASLKIARLPGGRRLRPLGRVAVALAVMTLLLLAAVLTKPWGFMAPGSAIGLLVVADVPAARAG